MTKRDDYRASMETRAKDIREWFEIHALDMGDSFSISEKMLDEAVAEIAKRVVSLDEHDAETAILGNKVFKANLRIDELEKELVTKDATLIRIRDALRELINFGLCGIDELRDAAYEKAETVWNETRSAPRVLWSGKVKLEDQGDDFLEMMGMDGLYMGAFYGGEDLPWLDGLQAKIIAIATEDSSAETK